jgi:hypothetical protein
VNKRLVLIVFVLGLILGVLGTIFLPRYANRYVPESIMGKRTIVDGEVLAKQRKDNTLLLTVNTPQGALLATFTRKADEVDLLIGLKDRVQFALDTYSPFVEDPQIRGVKKYEQTAPLPGTPGAAVGAVKTTETGSKEAKPRRTGKTAPVPKESSTTKP